MSLQVLPGRSPLSALIRKYGDVFLPGSSCYLLWYRIVTGQPGEKAFQVVSCEFPLKRGGDGFVIGLELEKLRLQGFQVREVVWGKDLPLHDRQVNLDLVQPTGMDRRVDLNGVGIPLREPFGGEIPSVRRSIVGHPEDPPCRPIRLLLHGEVNQSMKRLDAGCAVAQPKQLGSPHVAGGHVGQRPTALVFGLHPSVLMGMGRRPRGQPPAGLDAGLFVRADHVLVLSQRLPFPEALIQIQDTSRFLCEAGVARKNPAAMRPRLDGVGMEPAPYRRTTDGGHNATPNRLAGDVPMTETGQRQVALARQFARQRFNLHHDLRGKNRAVAHVLAGLPDRAGARRKIVFATC